MCRLKLMLIVVFFDIQEELPNGCDIQFRGVGDRIIGGVPVSRRVQLGLCTGSIGTAYPEAFNHVATSDGPHNNCFIYIFPSSPA